jgi:hypothetical protein
MRLVCGFILMLLSGWIAAQTGVLEASDPQLATGEHYDVHPHPATAAGVRLTIDLRSADFDVYAIILDPNGNPIAEFDDSEGLGTDLRETLTLPGPGVYFVVVTSAFAGEVGEYALVLSETAPLSKGNSSANPSAPPSATVPAATTPPAVASTPTSPQAGFVTGRVVGANGLPVSAPTAEVTVSITGVSYQSGQNVFFTATPNPDGRYSQRVVDGSYRVAAHVELTYDGQSYRFDLEPVGGRQSNRDSASGISQDFVWRIQGLKPGSPADSTNSNDYYGISIGATFQSVFSDRSNRWITIGPPDARVVFTLTPIAPLIDGSLGDTLTMEGGYDALYNNFSGGRIDVPIGIYAVSAVEIGADGRTSPLPIWDSQSKRYRDGGELRFTSSYGGAWASTLWFTRPD